MKFEDVKNKIESVNEMLNSTYVGSHNYLRDVSKYKNSYFVAPDTGSALSHGVTVLETLLKG